MSEQSVGFADTRREVTEAVRCQCGHPKTLHRVHTQIGNRNECWALNDNQLIAKWCQCRQFVALRRQSPPPGGADRGGEG